MIKKDFHHNPIKKLNLANYDTIPKTSDNEQHNHCTAFARKDLSMSIARRMSALENASSIGTL